jgi:hypothetical protein
MIAQKHGIAPETCTAVKPMLGYNRDAACRIDQIVIINR